QESSLKNFIVGIVFLGSLALVGVATYVIKGPPWGDVQSLSIRFPQIDNLKTGEDVRYRGLRVGQVDRLEFAPSEKGDILVVCSLSGPISIPLTDQTEFFVRSAGPLGGRFLEIVARPGMRVGSDWMHFVGNAEGDLFEQIREAIGDEGGLLHKLLRDPEFTARVEGAVDEFRGTFEKLNQEVRGEQSLVGRLFNDAELGDKVEAAVSEIQGAFAFLNGEDGPLRTIANDLEAQTGIAGALISDGAAKEKFLQTIDTMSAAASDLRSQKGLLGRLISSEELSETVVDSVDSLSDILQKANAGEGTVGQLLNNREAWDELVRVLVLAREAVEDMREQAPISTFANVFFAVF
ncbi:MAG: MCE family protein, partial [Planctomycetes bacterium]|nr:MCE family protein [Planctomycetota bacterium]